MLGLFLLLIAVPPKTALDIKVGVHVYTQYKSLEEALACLELTARDVKNINSDFNMTFVTQDHRLPDIHEVIREFDHFTQENVHAVVAPFMALEIEPVGKMAAARDILMLGYSAGNKEFGDKSVFSTLARFGIDSRELARAMALVIRAHGWNKVALISEEEHNPTDQRLFTAFRSIAPELGIEIAYDGFVDHRSELEQLRRELTQVKDKARVILLRFGNEIMDVRNLMYEAHDMNMTGPEYVYIVPWEKPRFSSNPWEFGHKYDDVLRELFSRSPVIVPFGYHGNAFDMWLSRLTSITEPRYNLTKDIVKTSAINWANLHDALYQYAKALDMCIKDKNCNWKSGADMFQMLKQSTITAGVSGSVHLNANGDRSSNYKALTFVEGKWVVNDMAETNKDGQMTLTQSVKIRWPTENGKPPPDTPPCGFQGEKCVQDRTGQIIALIVVVCLVICLSMVLWVRHRNKKFEEAILANSWKIDPLDLIALSNQGRFSLQSMRSLRSGGGSIQAVDDYGSGVKANFKGVHVLVFKSDVKKSFEITSRSDLVLLKQITEMQHENLNLFHGLAIEKSQISIVWSYCQKEGLDVIVHNPEIQLDLVFSSSILQDIVQGLNYLHSSKLGCHGQLSIRNCLVDSRWMVKLTNYGVDNVLKNLVTNGHIELPTPFKVTPTELTELAPELLREYTESLGAMSMRGNVQTDVYAYGMISYQVLFRENPFAMLPMEPTEIVERLKNIGAQLLRPPIPNNHNYNPILTKLITECWSEQPDKRPAIQDIMKILMLSLPARTNLVDHAVEMMEKYAKNLETMVENRTTELVAERQRADELLNRMLPKSIADSLKSGIHVEPESFEAISLLFTDVVGFTRICTQSTPLQVVQMMNAFYTLFDDFCCKFDVYKVETIGDAYMVASGLPIRNGEKHVTEIASLALGFRQAIESFKIEHIPDQSFKIRFGMHTGPVAAGVVGVSMPHYCLFGDTVNLASRMESNGLAMKIHITEETKEMLERQPTSSNFVITFRGAIEIKGKGTLKTFWLDAAGQRPKSGGKVVSVEPRKDSTFTTPGSANRLQLPRSLVGKIQDTVFSFGDTVEEQI